MLYVLNIQFPPKDFDHRIQFSLWETYFRKLYKALWATHPPKSNFLSLTHRTYLTPWKGVRMRQEYEWKKAWKEKMEWHCDGCCEEPTPWTVSASSLLIEYWFCSRKYFFQPQEVVLSQFWHFFTFTNQPFFKLPLYRGAAMGPTFVQ